MSFCSARLALAGTGWVWSTIKLLALYTVTLSSTLHFIYSETSISFLLILWSHNSNLMQLSREASMLSTELCCSQVVKFLCYHYLHFHNGSHIVELCKVMKLTLSVETHLDVIGIEADSTESQVCQMTTLPMTLWPPGIQSLVVKTSTKSLTLYWVVLQPFVPTANVKRHPGRGDWHHNTEVAFALHTQ